MLRSKADSFRQWLKLHPFIRILLALALLVGPLVLSTLACGVCEPGHGIKCPPEGDGTSILDKAADTLDPPATKPCGALAGGKCGP